MGVGRKHPDGSHHAFVFVLQQMTVIGKDPNDVGIAKIHTHSNTWVGQRAPSEVWDVHGIAKEVLVHVAFHVLEQQEMKLMDMECMEFARAVLDDPIFDGALVLNCVAVLAKAAEMALALHRITGSVVSRRGTFAKASAECVREFLSSRW